MDDELKDLIKHSPVWCEKDTLLQSTPGIGPVTSIALLAQMPELKHLEPAADQRAFRG